MNIKTACKTVAKMMRLQWTQHLHVKTLEAKRHSATMDELFEVGSFFFTCLATNKPWQRVKMNSGKWIPLTWHLVVHQGERIAPHDLSVSHNWIVNVAKAKGGFSDHKKAAEKDRFDLVILLLMSLFENTFTGVVFQLVVSLFVCYLFSAWAGWNFWQLLSWRGSAITTHPYTDNTLLV